MELIPLIRSNHRLSLNNKTKLSYILGRYPESEHSSLVLELIDLISLGEFEIMNYEEVEQLSYDVRELQREHVDHQECRDIAMEAANDVKKWSNEELEDQIKGIQSAYSNIEYFEGKYREIFQLSTELNNQLDKLTKSINTIAEFIDAKKTVNLRNQDQSNTLVEQIKRIQSISLRRIGN